MPRNADYEDEAPLPSSSNILYTTVATYFFFYAHIVRRTLDTILEAISRISSLVALILVTVLRTYLPLDTSFTPGTEYVLC